MQGIQGERALQVFGGLIVTPPHPGPLQGATIDQCIGVIGLQGKGFVVARQGVLKTVHLAQQHAPLVPGCGIVRIERDGPLIARQGLVKSPQVSQDITAISEGVDEVRPEHDRPFESLQRFFKLDECV